MNAKVQTAKVAKSKKPLDFDKFSGSAVKLNALKALDASKAPPDGEVELSLIDRKPQVREKFDEAKLEELAKDIKEQGLLQPILLRKKADGRYDLVAGERRYRSSILAGLDKVPYRLVPEDTDDFSIRRMQISENEQREDLTAYEKAKGVAEDVEKYGTEGACEIWGKKAPWISKRVSALRLPVPILALFRDEVISDVEMLNSLNNVLMLDEKEFSAIVGEIESGASFTREQLRDKESLIKERLQRQAEKETGEAKSTRATAKTMAPAAAGAGKTATAKKPSKSAEPKAATQAASPSAETEAEAAAAAALSAFVEQGQAKPAQAPTHVEAPKSSGLSRESLESKLNVFREELFQWGLLNQKQFMSIEGIVESLAQTGEDVQQLDNWVKWTGFQAIVLPLMAVLGEKTADVFLRRLAADLKKEKAGQIWDALYPLIDANAGINGKRDEAPSMPENWRF
ncbi:MAG: Chromosome-partitioning protein Spo0J [Herbaspirillum frisingense]|uniref:Chromosome-partitioning protein Spo0J n=1 Tax=Herbaspirillum frisingense TaxID=92645 RepID=A0A7V8FSN4_9BURK|nr:MAG: Chromosome-partitioning protein Spo0J [Herbaspirillum frisingense]